MDTKYINISSKLILILLLAILPISISPGNVHAAPGGITRISVDSSGKQANNYSKSPSISADGRFVAFRSGADNLVTGDTNATEDVFIYDRQTRATTRVSVVSGGGQANGYSSNPAISADGRFVTFPSFANNLVSDDTNGMIDIFVHDRQTGTTTRISVDSSGAEANGNSSEYYVAISGDGRFVAFQSEASNLVSDDTNGVADIFMHDRHTGATTRISVNSSGTQASGASSDPSISSDGRYIAFRSAASNLVSGDTNGVSDVFVHDRQTGATTRISVNSSGVQANGGGSSPSISGDGRYVVFLSKSDNLAPGTQDYEQLVYLHDRQTGQTTLVSVYFGAEIMVGTLEEPVISDNGQYVAFSFYEKGNGQGLQEIYLRNLLIGETIQVTQGGTSSEDSSCNPSLSADGSSLVFDSHSSWLVSNDTNAVSDIFVYQATVAPPDIVPSVISVIQNCPRGCISIADPIVDFTVTFSEPVTGVTADDFLLTTTGALTGTSIAGVIGSGLEYIVAVNAGNGTGTLRLDISDNDSIVDSTGNPLGGTGAVNGDFTSGDVYTVDRSIPIVTSILRADPNPTAAGSVRYTVAFSENVNGVDAGDFALTSTTGGITGASITAASGSGMGYIVNISTGTGEGTLRLDLLDNDSIVDEVGNPLGGSGTNNGNFLTGEIYTLDRNAPFVTISLPADPNPSAADSVRFTVGFTEPVSGVDAGDFVLSTTGDISGAAITNVSGSGNVYTVVTGTGSGSGAMRLDVIDNDSIVDALGNPLGGAGPSNGNFASGTAYAINKVPVNLIVEQLRSNGNNDGWILETGESSEQGGFKDSNSSTFVLGDNAQNNQFRTILHFPTQYIPNNAVITRVLLMILQEGAVGTNPFTTHQNITIDIRSGAFGFFGPFKYRGLQISDFQSPSDRDAMGVIENNAFNGWYWSYLDSSAFAYINRYGSTQLRLRFQVDDDNDFRDDYLRFYSGDYEGLANRPRLLVEYYIPR